jgi:hypothetical protein
MEAGGFRHWPAAGQGQVRKRLSSPREKVQVHRGSEGSVQESAAEGTSRTPAEVIVIVSCAKQLEKLRRM